MTEFWLKFGPCFGGLTFRNRGYLGSIVAMAHVTAAPKNGMFSTVGGFWSLLSNQKKILIKTAQSQSSWSDAPPPGSASLICSDGPVEKDVVFWFPWKPLPKGCFHTWKRGRSLVDVGFLNGFFWGPYHFEVPHVGFTTLVFMIQKSRFLAKDF